ncbi:uncharacterized protein LOC109722404 [Ananas comosus]|uniref:Uncharacterized protein LOC109722404 n=1 Tax=Ananas comosus TaxID=4615 RepID=A0A6P5GBQ9_ANACO|nr:uncharacterized protein LOC109722404 [Ananas comosus]
MEEFEESDILWPETSEDYHEDGAKFIWFNYNTPRSKANPLRAKPQTEEFEESDILWPDTPEDHYRDGAEHKWLNYNLPDESPNTCPPKPDGRGVSSPIDIPKRVPTGRPPSRAPALAGTVLAVSGESAHGASASTINGGQNFVPPHVVVARRINKRKMVLMIYGKTLEGRRNIIPQHVR